MASYPQALALLKKAVAAWKASGGTEEDRTLLEASCGLFAHTLVLQMGTMGDPTPEERAELEALSKDLEVIYEKIGLKHDHLN